MAKSIVPLQFTKHYELINYSPHGTYVNNVLYSNETIERPSVVNKQNGVPLEAQVRELIDKRRKVIRPKKSAFEGKMIAVDGQDRTECSCGNAPEDVKGGWEVSAVLYHGSLLRFGCVSFVFSIVDCAIV